MMRNASLALAYLLKAYDMLPAEQKSAKAQSDIPEKPRKRGKARRSASHRAP